MAMPFQTQDAPVHLPSQNLILFPFISHYRLTIVPHRCLHGCRDEHVFSTRISLYARPIIDSHLNTCTNPNTNPTIHSYVDAFFHPLSTSSPRTYTRRRGTPKARKSVARFPSPHLLRCPLQLVHRCLSQFSFPLVRFALCVSHPHLISHIIRTSFCLVTFPPLLAEQRTRL